MTRPLKIATIIDLSPRKLGSMEDSIISLVGGAARRGHRMDIFTFTPVHPVVAERIESAGARWENVESLLAHPVESARRLAREYDVLALNLFAPRSLMARIAYAAIPARVVFIDNFSGMPSESAPAGTVRRVLDHITTFRMSGLIAVSDYVLQRDMSRFGVRAPFARRIYNGIEPQRFKPPSGRPGPPTALAVASLIPEKGIHVLVEAFALIDIADARLDIVGEGPERARLEELSRSRGLESRVTFLGLRDDVDRLLQRAHVFVHPCVWEEAFGYTLAEALAAACPVVASRIGSTPELVTHGETGLLVPVGDVSSLALAVARVLGDAPFRERLGVSARASAVARFSQDASTEAHLDCYEQAAKR